jgi:hypothetical protein
MIPFEAAWDTITKNDLRIIPPYLREAVEDYMGGAEIAGVGEPDVEDVRDESSDDACCRSLKEAIAAIPIDTWGMHLLDEELRYHGDDGDNVRDAYENPNCDQFVATVQIQLEIWDYDFKDRADYDTFFGANPNLKSRVAFANPPFADAGEYAYDSDKEQLRKDQVRQALLEYQACKAQAEFDFGEEEEAHPLFTASANPFEAGWDSIVKMPFVPGSVREMTAEDSERWGFPEGTEMTQPNNPERYLPRPKLIGDFINEETGKLLPIIIQQGLKANPEAVEREKGMRRVFGDGLRDSRITTAHIPLDRLGMNPSTEMWFGGKQSDPHVVLDNALIEQIYTPKNFRRQGLASGILDALVEAGRMEDKGTGWWPSATDEEGRMIQDISPDNVSWSRPYVDTETGLPYQRRSPYTLKPYSGIATKDYIELMASRGLYPNIIQERDINYVPRGLFGMPTGEPLPKAGEPRAANPNNRWVDETAKENNLYFEANQWGSGYRGNEREDDLRGDGWGFDEEQPFVRPTASTIINRAKREAYHRNKVMRELEAASDKCPQTGEPDPITGKVHPYLEDSDIKEPNGCDCWDDWREARDAYFEEFPEHDWRLEFDEDDDEILNNDFHLAEPRKREREMIESGRLVPAPEPTWRLKEGKTDEYERVWDGKTLWDWTRGL